MKKAMKTLITVIVGIMIAIIASVAVSADTANHTVTSLDNTGGCPQIYFEDEQVFCIQQEKKHPSVGQVYLLSDETVELDKLAVLFYQNEYEPVAKGWAVWSVLSGSDASRFIDRMIGEEGGAHYKEIMATYKDVNTSPYNVNIEVYVPADNDKLQKVARFIVEKKQVVMMPAPQPQPEPEKEEPPVEVEEDEPIVETEPEDIVEEIVPETKEEEIVETIPEIEEEEPTPEIETPQTPVEEAPEEEPEVKGFLSAPQTGDMSGLSTVFTIAVISVAVIILCAILKKKFKNEE